MYTNTYALSTSAKPQNISALSLFTMHKRAVKYYSIIAIAVITLFPEFSDAVTNIELISDEKGSTEAFNNVIGLVFDILSKLVAIIALSFVLTGIVFRFNPSSIALAFGVALAATFGSSILAAAIDANF
jgi:hypothetical protein